MGYANIGGAASNAAYRKINPARHRKEIFLLRPYAHVPEPTSVSDAQIMDQLTVSDRATGYAVLLALQPLRAGPYHSPACPVVMTERPAAVRVLASVYSHPRSLTVQ